MIASELITKIQTIIDEEGDNEIVIDYPDDSCYLFVQDVVGKLYSGGQGHKHLKIYILVGGR